MAHTLLKKLVSLYYKIKSSNIQNINQMTTQVQTQTASQAVNSNKMTEYQQAFNKAEVKEREVLDKVFANRGITDYEYTPAGTSIRHDFIFRTDGKEMIGDIKCRNIKSTAYADTLVDYSKIEYLVNTAAANGQVPFLFVHFTDNVVCVWDLEKELPKIRKEVKYCNRTTAVSSGKKDKVVAMINIKNAYKLSI